MNQAPAKDFAFSIIDVAAAEWVATVGTRGVGVAEWKWRMNSPPVMLTVSQNVLAEEKSGALRRDA
jgi:hypothetical protein